MREREFWTVIATGNLRDTIEAHHVDEGCRIAEDIEYRVSDPLVTLS